MADHGAMSWDGAGDDAGGQHERTPGIRAALDAAGVGLGRINGDGVIESASPALCTLLGRAPDELVGNHLLALVEHPRRSGLVAALIRVIGGAEPASTLDFRHRDDDGHWHSITLTIAAVDPSTPGSGALIIGGRRDDRERPPGGIAPVPDVEYEGIARPYRAAQRRSTREGVPFVALSCRIEARHREGPPDTPSSVLDIVTGRIAERLRDQLRGTDLVLPLEADRLLAIAERVDDLDAAVGLGERLLTVADRPVWVGGHPVDASLSLHGGLVDGDVPFHRIEHLLDGQPGGIHLVGDAIHVADLRMDHPGQDHPGQGRAVG